MPTNLPWDRASAQARKIQNVVDHLVDALGGDPSCTLRRALILADIHENPGTTQAGILTRLEAGKSALNRDIEWLYDHGCILRQASAQDAREVRLQTCGYSRRSLDFALEHFEFSHKSLKNFLNGFISLFGGYKPTLRDAKILAALADGRAATKQDVFDSLYNGPVTTQNRAMNNLIELGLLERKDEIRTA